MTRRPDPPPSDASLSEWARWARAAGLQHLDPERLRDEARRQRARPHYGLGEPPPVEVEAEEAGMLSIDVAGMSGGERLQLGLALGETALRAAAGGAGRRHPVVVALDQVAAAVIGEDGQRTEDPVAVRVRLDRPGREQLHALLLAAHGRLRAERHSAERLVRRVLRDVELWAYGPAGYRPPPPPNESHPGWSSSEPFRALR